MMVVVGKGKRLLFSFTIPPFNPLLLDVGEPVKEEVETAVSTGASIKGGRKARAFLVSLSAS